MSTYTMFLNPQISSFPTDSPDPFFTHYVDTMASQLRYNVKSKFFESLALDSGESAALSFNAASTDWVVFLFRVVGDAKFTAVCKDEDNATNITGIFPTTGVSYYPGYIIWSTQRYVSGASVSASSDGTVVEAMVLVCEEDT